MACACGGKRGGGSQVEYVATFANGKSQTYTSESAAKTATRRNGGSYYARTKK